MRKQPIYVVLKGTDYEDRVPVAAHRLMETARASALALFPEGVGPVDERVPDPTWAEDGLLVEFTSAKGWGAPDFVQIKRMDLVR